MPSTKLSMMASKPLTMPRSAFIALANLALPKVVLDTNAARFQPLKKSTATIPLTQLVPDLSEI